MIRMTFLSQVAIIITLRTHYNGVLWPEINQSKCRASLASQHQLKLINFLVGISTEKQVDVAETDTEKVVNSDTIFPIFPRFL